MTPAEIVRQIEAYRVGARPLSLTTGWYAGITSNPHGRLFIDHQVDQQNGYWIYRNAKSNTGARQAEAELHRRGYRGGTAVGGGYGGLATTFVYAYRITTTTQQ